jgi:hypothetical protein
MKQSGVANWTVTRARSELGPLVRDLAGGTVALFCGSGVSIGAGYPSWDELLAPLRLELQGNDTTELGLLAQYYVNSVAGGRTALERLVLDAVSNVHGKFTAAHSQISVLPVARVITSNFDQLLETCYSGLDGKRKGWVVTGDEDLKYQPTDDSVEIMKMNGCITRPSSMILTSDDFEQYEVLHPLICSHLQSVVATETLLCIGTSMRDPVLKRILNVVTRALDAGRRPGYVIMGQCSEYEAAELERHGLNVVILGAGDDSLGDDVAKFLECLNLASREVRAAAEVKCQEPVRKESAEAVGFRVEMETSVSDLLASRVATGLSLQYVSDLADHRNRYTAIRRIDFLDYESGDFVSVRRLRGVNTSDEVSSYVLYQEASENKCRFREMGVVARDYVSGADLYVEAVADGTKARMTHPFRVFFPQPLQQGESFDLIYRIVLPGELGVLSIDHEMMSISLVRAVRGVERLDFDVVLNYRPRAVDVTCANSHGAAVACRGNAPVIEEYLPEETYERQFGIAWSDTPWVIRWGCDYPDSSLYMIEYHR